MPRTTARRRPAALLLCAASLVATSGCQVASLQFRNDHRLQFSAPASRKVVTAPLTISWTMKDFSATGLDGQRDAHSGAYAVFVDRAPMPVGKDLKWLAREDAGCKRDPRCPDQKYLADRGIFLTTDTSVTVDILPAAPDGVGDEEHYVNVVLVDGTGHRIGESAWYRAFQSKRRTQ
ncbi:MAG: hypothetical protein JWO88_2009 [Frankiales bacterium]|nr:hypothetical protein [Frankiales bacterium]